MTISSIKNRLFACYCQHFPSRVEYFPGGKGPPCKSFPENGHPVFSKRESLANGRVMPKGRQGEVTVLKGASNDFLDLGVSENRGISPQIIHFNRGFPLFSPSILGETPLFLETPIWWFFGENPTVQLVGSASCHPDWQERLVGWVQHLGMDLVIMWSCHHYCITG